LSLLKHGLDLNGSNPSTLQGFRHRGLDLPQTTTWPIDFAAPRGHESVHNGQFPIMNSFSDV
jgi:hypothetical protein